MNVHTAHLHYPMPETDVSSSLSPSVWHGFRLLPSRRIKMPTHPKFVMRNCIDARKSLLAGVVGISATEVANGSYAKKN